jgi:hypothetical protein
MHHYSVYTTLSLSEDAEIIRLWKVAIPEEALKYPFLMQGLLALSALHLTSSRPADRALWIPLALKHQNIALSLFRSIIPTINEHNCHALFTLSILISITSMALSCFGIQVETGQTLHITDAIVSPICPVHQAPYAGICYFIV